MTDLARIRVEWTGLVGLPGLSTFYVDTVVSPDVSDLVAFFNGIKSFFPPGLQWNVPSSGDVIDDTNGELQGVWTGTGASTVAATGTFAAYPAGTGARIRWLTGGIVGGRRVTGATFLTPMTAASYQDNGTLNDTMISTVSGAATTLLGAMPIRVWHRNHSGSSDGSSWVIEGVNIPDRVTSLRSRRV